MNKILLIFLLFTFSGTCFSQNVSWEEMESNGEVLARHENALVTVGNKMILIGGRGEKPINIYDVGSGEWTTGAQPPMEIHHMQAVTLDGLVYITGGFTGNWPYETPLSNFLIYDITEDSWVIGPEIPVNRRRGAAGTVVYDDKIYIVNGIINGHTSGWVNWLDEYDPYTNTWNILPDSPQARDHFQAAVINDKLYVAGGRRSGSTDSGFGGTVKEAARYDFQSKEWEQITDIPTTRAGTASGVFKDGYVVMGGESDSQEVAHNEVEKFNPETGKWEKLPPLKEGRHGTQVISQNNLMITGAGSANRGGGPELTSFEVLTAGDGTNLAEMFPAEIKKSEISSSAETIDLSTKTSESISITNTSQDKAAVITYLLLDNPENFEIEEKLYSPIILAPGQNFELKVKKRNTANANSSSKLFIKTVGDSEPLRVEILN